MAVVLTSNIVRMAFYLMLSLGATAGLFFLAGAEFVGAMQLMIYVGGTLVLLIFGVMLTAQARFISMKTRGRRMGAGGDARRRRCSVLLLQAGVQRRRRGARRGPIAASIAVAEAQNQHADRPGPDRRPRR